MLKSVMITFISLTTSMRLMEMIYILAKGNSNLPIVVLVFVGIIIIMGAYIMFRQGVKKLRLRELVVYFILYSLIMAFNMLYILFTVPLSLSALESLMAGSLIEIIAGVLFMYYSVKQIRNQYVAVDTTQVLENEEEKENEE